MTTTPRLDPQAMQELRQVMDDEFELLMAMFVDDSQARVTDLQTARSSWPALRRAAHAFKGSSSNIGAAALSECCLLLEQHCQDVPSDDPATDLERADQLIASICEEQKKTVALINTEILKTPKD